MQLVIDIPNRIYKIIQNKTLNIMDAEILEKAVKNGIPLPKGHGALKDADEVMKVMERNCDMQDLYLPIHFKQFALDEAQTIVEADKEGEEYNNDDSIAILKAMQESADAVRNSPQYDFSCVKELLDKEVDE